MKTNGSIVTASGLTKREHMVIEIAKGLCSDTDTSRIATLAVKIADEVINELNKKQDVVID